MNLCKNYCFGICNNKCKNKHINCSFGIECTKINCQYGHPVSPELRLKINIVIRNNITSYNKNLLCPYGITCINHNCINHHKILAVIDSINISQAYIDVDIKNDDERDVVRNDKMEVLRAQVENVKALEDCKNYYNDIYGKM